MIELKLYRDSQMWQDGLEQTAEDVSQFGLDRGYLILFETRAGKTWEERIYREVSTVDGKTVIVMGERDMRRTDLPVKAPMPLS